MGGFVGWGLVVAKIINSLGGLVGEVCRLRRRGESFEGISRGLLGYRLFGGIYSCFYIPT
jgi:hypothetical protein